MTQHSDPAPQSDDPASQPQMQAARQHPAVPPVPPLPPQPPIPAAFAQPAAYGPPPVYPAPQPTPYAGASSGQYFGPAAPQPAPAAAHPARKHRGALIACAGVGAVAMLGLGAVLGANLATGGIAAASSSGSGSQSQTQQTSPQGPNAGYPGYGSGSDGSGSTGQDGSGGFGDGGGSSSGSSTGVTGTPATTAQSQGVALITTTVDYGAAQAAGTGMVVTGNGEVLTNNHVVAGATTITVEIPTTGAKYTAKVVGTDAADDVAVLQLQNASGLTTATFDTAGDLQVGDSVTGVGNAQGGGELIAAPGTVTALDQSLTTQAEQYADSESLSGMIETDAAIQSGDSGGPLYAADGEIVGMDTAASSGGTPDSFAIPIQKALSIAEKITSGTGGSGIQLGYPAFLGVQVGQDATGSASGIPSQTDGAAVAGVIDGTPAANAGLQQGDVITAVNGTAITSSSDLSRTLAGYKPGDKVTITWTDASGQSQQAQVTLAEGPAA
ncbi:S1C family serine protease [Microbacterium mangrovi]|uniref:S1C family serine protease n=1 Tax=Microbacterium mangrovi TaxID=1348253 RepID=UPI00068ABEDF|nr:trypsin-like peptidase domain-containing protein [Microbacterium mangrovi]